MAPRASLAGFMIILALLAVAHADRTGIPRSRDTRPAPAADPVAMQAGRRLVLLVSAATAALTLALADEADAGSGRVHVKPVSNGVVVRVIARPARAVSFTLAGRPLARRHRPPYRVFVRGHRRAARRPGRVVWLVAKDMHNGRRLARVRLEARTSRSPVVTITRGPERVTSSAEARFAFTVARARRIRCRLDSGPETRCTKSAAYRALTPGSHVFRVRGEGGRGNATAFYAWTITGAGGPPTPGGRTAAPPTAPSPYTPPAAAVVVSTSAALERALSVERSSDIVLADGVYDNDEPFVNAFGHRVHAARLGGAVLRAGFMMGHNWGPGNGMLRGLAFDVTDPAKTPHGDIVHVWGTGKGSRLLDLTFNGHKAVRSGIMVREPEGVVIQRVVARNFSDWGVIVDANDVHRRLAHPPLVEDVVATDVTRTTPQASGGRSEACVWIGNTAVVRRVFAARCAWEGLWTGTASRGAVFEDIRVVESETGVYAEHYNSAGTTFRRLDIGPSVKRGVNCEWSDPAWGGIAGCIDVVVEDSLFDTTRIGVYLDEGTTRTTIRRSVFRNQQWAAIADHKGVANAYYENDVSGLRVGAVPLSYDHLFQHWS
jgi:hypothetical protein